MPHLSVCFKVMSLNIIHSSFILLPERHFGCFHCLASAKRATVNITVQVFRRWVVDFGHIWSSSIAKPQGRLYLAFGNSRHRFPKWLLMFSVSALVRWFTFSPFHLQHLVSIVLLSLPDRRKMIFKRNCNVHFPFSSES